jgi:transposase
MSTVTGVVMGTVQQPAYEWKGMPWKQIERYVLKLQKRIYRASVRGDVMAVHRLQRLLMKSWSAKALAVRRVTQDNRGKNTAGLDGVRRAKAVLAIAAGKSFTEAAHQSGFKSADSIAQLVGRFNRHGLAALDIARGREPKPTYDSAVRARILQKVQTPPDRTQDGTATWSLSTLERSLRQEGGELATLGATTI